MSNAPLRRTRRRLTLPNHGKPIHKIFSSGSVWCSGEHESSRKASFSRRIKEDEENWTIISTILGYSIST